MSRLPMADRRDQLIAAALTIAARDGIEAATVRAVAIEAGVSAGVVHYCFSDKNELLTCMAEAITAMNTPTLPGAETAEAEAEAEVEAEPGPDPDAEPVTEDAAAAPSAPDPANAQEPAAPIPVGLVLGEFLSTMWGSLESTRGFQLLTYELTVTALRSPDLAGVAQAQYVASRAAASAVLEQVADLAQVTWSRPVEDLARIVVAAIDGASLAWLVDGDGEAAQRTLSSTVDLLASFARG